MQNEIHAYDSRKHWEIIERSILPLGMKTIQAIWSFKRKQYPDSCLNKNKARICAHGGMQQRGVFYWEIYNPVVNLLTVKLLLVLCNIHCLESKSVDFVLAFPQADLDVDIWMEVPQGFDVADQGHNHSYVLKLKKSLYGLKQSSLNWFDRLKTGLVDRGSKSSDIDPCLYLRDCMIILTYVDDCIIIGEQMSDINTFIDLMHEGQENFILTDEGDVNKFLGIETTKYEDSLFELSQPFLIDRIVNFLGLCRNEFETDANTRSTPVVKGLLHRDLTGKQPDISPPHRHSQLRLQSPRR